MVTESRILIDDDALMESGLGVPGESVIVVSSNPAAALGALQRAADRFMCVDGRGVEHEPGSPGTPEGGPGPSYAAADSRDALGPGLYVDCSGGISVRRGLTFRRILCEELETGGVESARVVTSHVGIWLPADAAVDVGEAPTLGELIDALPELMPAGSVLCLYSGYENPRQAAEGFLLEEGPTIGCGWKRDSCLRIPIEHASRLRERGLDAQQFVPALLVYRGETVLLTAFRAAGFPMYAHPSLPEATLVALCALADRGRPIYLRDVPVDDAIDAGHAELLIDGRLVGERIEITVDRCMRIPRVRVPAEWSAACHRYVRPAAVRLKLGEGHYWWPAGGYELPVEAVAPLTELKVDLFCFEERLPAHMPHRAETVISSAEGAYVVVPARPAPGGVVRVDIAGKRYWCPPERARRGDGFEDMRDALPPSDGSPGQTAVRAWVVTNLESLALRGRRDVADRLALGSTVSNAPIPRPDGRSVPFSTTPLDRQPTDGTTVSGGCVDVLHDVEGSPFDGRVITYSFNSGGQLLWSDVGHTTAYSSPITLDGDSTLLVLRGSNPTRVATFEIEFADGSTHDATLYLGGLKWISIVQTSAEGQLATFRSRDTEGRTVTEWKQRLD